MGLCTQTILLPASAGGGSGRSEPRPSALSERPTLPCEPRLSALPHGPFHVHERGLMAECTNGKHDTQVHLRVTEDDAARMRNAAAASGMSLSAYIRRAALAGRGAASVADARSLRPLYGELRRCGNNVNQVARALNTYGPGGVPAAAVAAALDGIERATDAVAEELARARR